MFLSKLNAFKALAAISFFFLSFLVCMRCRVRLDVKHKRDYMCVTVTKFNIPSFLLLLCYQHTKTAYASLDFEL
jgi:Kef-type K+ transport system membrane component KefB